MDLKTIYDKSINVNVILEANEPVVLKGEASDWPCYSLWTWEFLATHYHLSKVPVRRPAKGRIELYELGGLLQEVFKGGDAYGVDWDFAFDLPELVQDLGSSIIGQDDCFARLPAYIRPNFRWLYIGGAGTGSPLHQDVLCTHAWMAVLKGRKHWVLYPPNTFDPYSKPNYDAFANGAYELDVQHGHQRIEGYVEAGDVIFVPSLWWHQVKNMGPTLGLTVNFCSSHIRSRVCSEAALGRYAELGRHLMLLC